jgi:hypothetical protein
MDTFSTSDLRKLTAQQQGPCVSIFMPTHAAGRDGQQDALRLKNLLGQAERGLIDQGLRAPDARRLIDAARELPNEPGFWEKRSHGLAVFITEGVFQRFRVPLALDEKLLVNRRFQVRPLLPLLTANDQFFLLALSQNRARLFQVNQLAIREIKVEGMPKSLPEALNYDVGGRPAQVHSAAGGQGGQGSVFHGQGEDAELSKDDVARYFRLIDAALREPLRDQRSPLILAGVQYLLPIYREISHYACIAAEELPGNPDHLSEQELHDRARPVMTKHVENVRETAAAKYRQLAGTGKTADDVPRVVAAAHQGQVESLFVDRSSHRWGTFDPATGNVDLHAAPQPGDDELLDLSAVQTLLNRGAVFAVPAEQVPSPPISAVFRY